MSIPPGPPPGDHPSPGGGYGEIAPTSEERNWALAAHVGVFVAAWFALGFLAPLAVMLVKGNSSPFVRRHSVESLNFQITLLIAIVVGVVLTVITFGLGAVVVVPVGLAVAVFALVVIILATIKAANGEEYRYPLNLRLIK